MTHMYRTASGPERSLNTQPNASNKGACLQEQHIRDAAFVNMDDFDI